jgi:hypothetical protein
VIITDKSTSYEDFSQLFETHLSFKSDKKTTKTTLKWVHITISNAKRNLLGVYHMIKMDYLQNYLNEFCYRLNRRSSVKDSLTVWLLRLLEISGTFAHSQFNLKSKCKFYEEHKIKVK